MVHGGISDQTDVEKLEKIPRHRFQSVLRPPVNKGMDMEKQEAVNVDEWKQMLDIMWSDPKQNKVWNLDDVGLLNFQFLRFFLNSEKF